jgi:hypothetical protein
MFLDDADEDLCFNSTSTPLIAREDFTTSIRRESVKSYTSDLTVTMLGISIPPLMQCIHFSCGSLCHLKTRRTIFY